MADLIDETDRRILRVLQKDAGQSLDSLAETVALSRNACWRRIKAMEDRGVIRGRVALVDAEAVGVGLTVFVMVRTNRHDPDWLRDFKTAVSRFPEIIGAHRMAGDLDYVLRVRVADVAGYDRFYQRFITHVELADVSASFVMEDLHDTWVVPV